MNRTDIPGPIYAAAGAGEIAYQKLRKLPAVAARTADGLRQRFASADRDQSVVDLARIRRSAQRGTAQLVAQAATVPDRTAAGYRRLVARGERVMAERGGVPTSAPEPAGIEVEVGQVRPAERAAGSAERAAGPAKSGAADEHGGAAKSGSGAAKSSGGTGSGQ
ncbi:MAG: hypothetical protein GEV12_18340 [Micromonosporaceae bacterium]|nr:hypothetical protein [Micromonosporaceae bacterium]